MNSYKIYLYRNKITRQIYIGQTKDSLIRRARNGEGYNGCPYFYNAIKEYGWDNFESFIIEDNLTSQKADEREQYWIMVFQANNPKKGYNIKSGGKGYDGHNNGSDVNRKAVYCKETGQKFDSLMAAAKWAGLDPTSAGSISLVARGEKCFAGHHPITQEPLHWCFLKEELNLPNKQPKIPGSKQVKNLDTNEVFDSVAAAARVYHISQPTITKSCRSNGQLAVGSNKGPKYHWIYTD